MEEERRTHIKNKIVRPAIAGATALSLLLGGLFSSPAELTEETKLRQTPPAAVQLVVPDLPDDGPSDDGDEDSALQDEEKKKGGLRSALRRLVLRIPRPVRIAIGVPLWAVGWVIIAGLSALWSAFLSPVAGMVLTWLSIAAVILGILVCFIKMVCPDLPVKKILNRKTFLAVICSVAVLGVVDAIAPNVWDGYETVQSIFRAVASAAVLAGVSFPFLKKRRSKA